MNCRDFSAGLGRVILGDAASDEMIDHAAECIDCAKNVSDEHKRLIIRRLEKSQIIPNSIIELSVAIRNKKSGKA